MSHNGSLGGVAVCDIVVEGMRGVMGIETRSTLTWRTRVTVP